ncbi:hypothetical protein Hypma_007568 [Hypsizygus marmoreus]|uniref:F-box domain-containing protein n=1 Tax=Hypsizygus marmoreus TaxID=39966 RepID=A0A369K351_HYPMA|nr:hypothetical protein Hypma_007568 [Hypsizygus marmoreus]
MTFNFTGLPTELALEIIRLAATPNYEERSSSRRPYYATALSLASVSYAVRQATMRHLLHTVVLSTHRDHIAFNQTLYLQSRFAFADSRLALDYPKLVRKFWSTQCWAPVVEDRPEARLNYAAFYGIMRNAECIGLHGRSMHLLHEALSSNGSQPTQVWSCRRVIIIGPWRWKPLTSTPEGLAFLRQITHLAACLSIDKSFTSQIIPPGVQEIPFALMPNLTHFAYPLLRNRTQEEDSFCTSTEMIAYVVPPQNSVSAQPLIRQWLCSPDALAHGFAVPFREMLQSSDALEDLWWERVFLQGDVDSAFVKADRMKSLRGHEDDMVIDR